ncbi:MAG: S24 family peptidase [Pseudomonadales bacterium]
MDQMRQVEECRKALNWSKVEMAIFFGVKYQAYNNWVRRNSLPKNFYTDAVWLSSAIVDGDTQFPDIMRAQALSAMALTRDPLLGMKEKAPSGYDDVNKLISDKSLAGMYRSDRLVPIIKWGQAAEWERLVLNGVIPSQRLIACPDPCSDLTFALTVQDDQMHDKSGGVPKGSTIYVDPTVRNNCEHGAMVVARQGSEGEITFRQYHTKSELPHLVAINQLYNHYVEDIEIVGKVIGYYFPL